MSGNRGSLAAPWGARGWMFALAWWLLSGCSTSPQPNPPPASASRSPGAAHEIRMTDVTAETGVDFTYRNGRDAGVLSIVESLGGGVGVFDYDGDGRLDLFFPGGGKIGPGQQLTGLPAGLFRQVGRLRFVEVSASAGVDVPRHYSHGCTVGDYDNDGFPDVLVTGYSGLQLFHNQGDGTFAEVQDAAGLHDTLWSSSAGWGDADGDGRLDLYVAHYTDWSWENNPPCESSPGRRDVCPPREFCGLDDTLYLANGDGTFRDATREAGLKTEGKGLGVLLNDLDQDGDLDVYVANDTVDNFLYVNDGQGKLQERSVLSGAAVDHRGAPNGSMGLAALDYNHDLRPDLWVSNFENESFALYRNDGAGAFTHVSQSVGIFALGSYYVGFGTVAVDLERDGDEDLIVANGHVIYYPPSGRLTQEPLLLVNEEGRFSRRESSSGEYFGQLHHGRGLAVGDLDDDGDLDCVFSNSNGEPAAVVRNDTAPAGEWLRLKLIGTRSNRDAVGAWAVLHTTAGDLFRSVSGGGSYLSHSDLRLFWGLPPESHATSLTIHWPGGAVQQVPLSGAHRDLQVIER